MNWYTDVLKKYVQFSGRARRKEYWFFMLFNTLVVAVLAFIDMSTGRNNSTTGIGLLSGLYALATFLPQLGVTVRRLHDIDRTGWWVLLGVIPLIGELVLIVFLATNGTAGDNRYGPDPKAATT